MPVLESTLKEKTNASFEKLKLICKPVLGLLDAIWELFHCSFCLSKCRLLGMIWRAAQVEKQTCLTYYFQSISLQGSWHTCHRPRWQISIAVCNGPFHKWRRHACVVRGALQIIAAGSLHVRSMGPANKQSRLWRCLSYSAPCSDKPPACLADSPKFVAWMEPNLLLEIPQHDDVVYSLVRLLVLACPGLIYHLASRPVGVCRWCIVILYMELLLLISIIFPWKVDGPVVKDDCTYGDVPLWFMEIWITRYALVGCHTWYLLLPVIFSRRTGLEPAAIPHLQLTVAENNNTQLSGICSMP